LAEALSICAARSGDTFALLPFDSGLHEEIVLRKTLSRAAHSEAVRKLRAFVPERGGVQGITAVGGALAGSKKLVFLISDFLWSAAEAERACEALAFHDVVPIEIDDSLHIDELPEWGLLNLRDLESGKRRLVAMRPSLKARWRAARTYQRDRIRKIFETTTRQMFTIRDGIDWPRLTSFLLYGSA
jgi:hypothetical protein